MQKNIYERLGYVELLIDNLEIAELYPSYSDLTKIGADKIYFSGNHPAVLFLDVKSFSNSNELKRIVDIQHKAWNYRKVILLFAISNTEIRIYNCYEKPLYIADLEDSSYSLTPAELLR